MLRLVGLGPSADANEVEIAVLRHQLMVLRRQVARPRYTPTDRVVLATLAKLPPRARWPVFLVTPATLLRWHRELVAAGGPIHGPGTAGVVWIRRSSSWWCIWPGSPPARPEPERAKRPATC